jgi:hypothetical protein
MGCLEWGIPFLPADAPTATASFATAQ